MDTEMKALSADKTVAVIGAGTMGAGIAQVAATAGHPVLLFDVAAEAVDKGIAGIVKVLDRSVERGRIEAAERDAILARIQPASALTDLAPAGLVVLMRFWPAIPLPCRSQLSPPRSTGLSASRACISSTRRR
jgi:UDP-N-acetyl-D-mannosaminuronate dehydrogenase